MVSRDDAGFEDGERPGLPVEPIFAAGMWLFALSLLVLKIGVPSGADGGEFLGIFIQVVFAIGFTGHAFRLEPDGWKHYRVNAKHILFFVAGLAFITSLSCLIGVGTTAFIFVLD